jgi:hypothetical protein
MKEEENEPEVREIVEKPTVTVVRSDTARKMLSKFRELEEKAMHEHTDGKRKQKGILNIRKLP